jgi:hypothetical protein
MGSASRPDDVRHRSSIVSMIFALTMAVGPPGAPSLEGRVFEYRSDEVPIKESPAASVSRVRS